MKKCKWSVLKRENDGKQLNLEVEDQLYIDKVVRYLNSHKNGMMETEIVRKDLIGLAAEAKEEGISLEQKLGSAKEFGETLALAGKEEKQKERLYYFLWQIGSAYLLAPVIILAILAFGKLIAIVLNFEFQFEKIRFNLPFSLCYLVLPPLFSIYEVFFKYYFILFYPVKLARYWVRWKRDFHIYFCLECAISLCQNLVLTKCRVGIFIFQIFFG